MAAQSYNPLNGIDLSALSRGVELLDGVSAGARKGFVVLGDRIASDLNSLGSDVKLRICS